MSRPDGLNPFEPPKARVADPESSEASTPPPTVVMSGVACLYVALAMGALSMLPGLFAIVNADVFSWILILGAGVSIVMFAGFCWLVFRIARGRRWARIVYTILYLVGVFVLGAQYAGLYESPVTLTVGSAIRHLIPALGLVLLFTPASNAWFRKRNGA